MRGARLVVYDSVADCIRRSMRGALAKNDVRGALAIAAPAEQVS